MLQDSHWNLNQQILSNSNSTEKKKINLFSDQTATIEQMGATSNTDHGRRESAAIDAGHALAVQAHFDQVKSELTDFGRLFEQWASSRRQALVEDKQAYERTLAEENDLVEALKKQLTSLIAKRQSIVAALQAEQREYEQEMRANAELEEQKKALQLRLAQLKEQSERLGSSLVGEEEELARLEAIRNERRAKERLELALSEEKLSLRVEAVGNDSQLTRFSFTRVDPADWDRRFTIVLDVSQNKYRVVSCEPPVNDLASMIQTLNEAPPSTAGQLCSFLRSLRDAFVASC